MSRDMQLVFKGKVIETGSIDHLITTLIEYVGEHSSITSVIAKGWRIQHIEGTMQ